MKIPNTAPIMIDLDESQTPALAAAPVAPAVVDEDPAAVIDEDADLAGGLPARAVVNEDGSVTLPLRLPVTLQIRSASTGTRSESYRQLTFHRLLGADVRAVQTASKESAPVVLFARSARIREAVMNVLFDRMDAADVADGSRIVDSFFGSGPTKSA